MLRLSRHWASAIPFYGSFGACSRDLTPREEKLELLTRETFGTGNKYLKSCVDLRTLPLGNISFPEVCFVGHTNAGKSSIVSALLHNKRLGRAHHRKGSTTKLEFFNAGDAIALVDTPGYGYSNHTREHALFKRARGQGLTKQYIALRKHTNLKRVYLVVDAMYGIRPRDRDMVAALVQEGVPYTVLMSRIDRLGINKQTRRRDVNPMALIPECAQRIFDALGSEKIPLLEISAREKFNLEMLQKDIVFNCASELADDELTVGHLRQLSYSPASVQVQLAVEARHRVEDQLIPKHDQISLAAHVRSHLGEAKFMIGRAADAGLLLPSHAAATIEGKDLADLRADALGASDVDSAISGPMVVQALAAPSAADPSIEAESLDGGSGPQNQLLAGDATGPDMSDAAVVIPAAPRDDRNHLSLSTAAAPASAFEELENLLAAAAPSHGNNNGGLWLAPRVALPSANIGHPHSDVAASAQRATTGTTTAGTGALQPLAPAAMSFKDACGVVGIEAATARDAPSVVQTDVLDNLRRMEKTPQKYREMIESPVRAVMEDDGLFLEKRRLRAEEIQRMGGGEWDHDAPFARPVPHRVERQKAMLNKYVERVGVHNERAIRLDAQGYMCPWLGTGDHQSLMLGGAGGGGRGPGPSAAATGSRMRGLKQRGWGGHSLPPNTLRGRGRSTLKQARWAR